MNRIMDNLDKNQFIVMLDTLLNRRLSDAECTAFHASYKEFIDLLHELARLQSRLMRLQERIVEKESPQASLLKSALLLTNFEIRLVFTRLVIHPSPLRYRSKYPNHHSVSLRTISWN